MKRSTDRRGDPAGQGRDEEHVTMNLTDALNGARWSIEHYHPIFRHPLIRMSHRRKTDNESLKRRMHGVRSVQTAPE